MMDPHPHIGSLWLLATCVGIVMLSCYISGVACDVPDDVYTDLHKTVRIGDSVVLKCQFRGTPLAVNWKKGGDPIRAPNLVSWIPGDPVTGVCVGERLCQIMEMNAEFSLIIKEVSIVEQGRYICTVANYKGNQIHNFTDISVFSPPKEPYPIINECQMISPNDTETTCTISTSQSVEISCSASGYFPDIDLYFLHGSTRLYTKETIEVTNLDKTKKKTIYTYAAASEISYVCSTSNIPGLQEQRTTTVLVNLPETPFPMPAGLTIPIDKTDGSVAKIVIPVIFIVLLAVICISLVLWRQKKRQRGQGTYAKAACQWPSVGIIYGILSDFELEYLVKKFDVGSLTLIVAELMGDSKGELESELTKADLYKYLCQWKESSSGSAILLYSAMEENNLENELQIVKDFLASTDNAVSDDDLEHICWHVHSCRETVQPILDSLQYSSTKNSTKPADNGLISTPSRCEEIRKDLQIMKRWKAMSAAAMYGDEDEHTESMPSNQMIQLCRALEKAGKMTGNSDGQVYHQLSKTFYKIQEQYKSKLTDEVLKEFALNITKRHCQRLGKTFRLSARAIANRNEEDLEMFRTDIMLKVWVQDQKCSNYEIRRRLRQAAEQCDRQDIADIFIRKEQSEVMTSTIQLTITNEKQNPGASRSESVSSISRDELYRIGRYAGSAILRAFCKKYGVKGVPGQQSPEGIELLLEIINVLKPTLDSEFGRIKKDKKSNTPRKILRQLLENEHPGHACLLAKKKKFCISNVELIDLAYRLIMADVYPFAKALNISDQVLNSYRRNLGPYDLTRGTANIMKQVNTDNRVKMVTPLRQAGYSEEARALYYGFEISVGDVIEVENRVDMAQLAKQLGVPDDVQSTGPDNQVEDDTLHQSVILQWRDTVCSSTFNHRLVLADALFSMGEKQLALDIISGVFRNGVMNKQVAELLAATILVGQLPTLVKILDQTKKNEEKRLKQKSPTEMSNKLLAAGFNAHAHEVMAGAYRGDKKAGHKEGTETGNVATEELRQGGIAINEPGTRKGEVGEKELEPVAIDIETIPTEEIQETNTSEEGKGGSQNSEDKKSSEKEATDTNNVVAEISVEENPSTKEKGSKHGKEYDKASEEEGINKNGTDGEQISLDDDAMQEKSGDEAAESEENTTENVDMKEQDGLDECRGDESSKLLIQARA